MNSSLLVPGLIVVAVTAGVFVFGDGLFSGGSPEPGKKVTFSQSKAKQSADVADVKASVSRGSDFSWDEETAEPSQSPVQKPVESFVSTKPTEEAPGELYGSDFDSQADDSQADASFDSVDEFAANDFGSSNGSADENVDDSAPAWDKQAASKQVDEDLSDFFDKAPKAAAPEASTSRSSVANREQAPSASKAKAVNSSDLDVALASPKPSGSSVDSFDNFGSAPSDFTPAPRTNVDNEMKSVVMPEVKETAAKKSDFGKANAGTEISGALEPMNDSKSLALGGSKSGVSAKAPVRKFKITNPKETTLAVTLSVDGKQVTLKPDQSFVIQQSDGDVEVTFSRGGSFGFERKTLKKGHYRFTVSREAGWQLIN